MSLLIVFVLIKSTSIDSIKNDSMKNAFMKNVVMDPRFYDDNIRLDKQANQEIKSLLLQVMKARHSTFFLADAKKLYTEECLRNENPLGTTWIEKGLFIVINYGFMHTVRTMGENEYNVKIQMEFPEDWCYYFTVKVIDDKYVVSYYEIDP